MKTLATTIMLVLMAVGCTAPDGRRYDTMSNNRKSRAFLRETVREGEVLRKRQLATTMQFSARAADNRRRRNESRAFALASLSYGERSNFRQMLSDLGDELRWDSKKIRHSTLFGLLDTGDP